MHAPVEQLLLDAELIAPEGITYAALILLGGAKALSRFLPQAEVVFEYRSVESAGPAAHRIEFREGFLLFYDRLWAAVHLRNDFQHYQEGLFMVDVPTFSEGSVREAILNAVSHRDYRHQGSVFVRQFARRIEVVSPGGFPPGITAESILDQQLPRNRRIAESFGRGGLVERSGQGANRMFEEKSCRTSRAIRYKHSCASSRRRNASTISGRPAAQGGSPAPAPPTPVSRGRNRIARMRGCNHAIHTQFNAISDS